MRSKDLGNHLSCKPERGRQKQLLSEWGQKSSSKNSESFSYGFILV